MTDDLDALLARADSLVAALNREPQPWWDDEHCLDNGQAAVVAGLLVAALRESRADYEAALDVIARLSEGWGANGRDLGPLWFRGPLTYDPDETTEEPMSEREWRVYCDAARRAIHRSGT